MYAMGRAEVRAVARVIRRQRFFRYGGAETAAFERDWARLVGVRHATTVTSGTAALVTSLQAMGIGPGQSVLVPGYTFLSTALAVTAVGAVPILVDVDETLTMDPADADRKGRRHTSCVIPVHMQGMPCRMAELLRLARRRGWRVLEDCCQADGGSYRGRRLGSLGDMGVFSFNQYKILSCGEGGAAVTSNRRLAERLFMAHDGSCCVWPETGPMNEAFFCGGNFRSNEISAAILRVQVRRLEGILADLRRTRRRFKAGLRLPPGFRLVDTADERGDCGVCFLVQAPDRAAAVRAEPLFAAHLSVHRPVNSGRHVYSAWRVVRDRVGGHHPAWDCFRHPANRAIRTNYDAPLPQADDYLARTLLCRTPYRWPAARTARAVRALNGALAGMPA